MHRRYDLIVFDWDGTLADSTSIIASAIQAACRDLGQPVPDDVTARYVIGLGLAGAARHAVPELQPAEYPRLSEAIERTSLEGSTKSCFSMACLSSCTSLRARAICCHRYREVACRTHEALARSGLTNLFKAKRCADEDQPKPHPAMLQNLMSDLAHFQTGH